MIRPSMGRLDNIKPANNGNFHKEMTGYRAHLHAAQIEDSMLS